MNCSRWLAKPIRWACISSVCVFAVWMVSPQAHSQDQFIEPLSKDTRVTQANLKVINCGSSVNPQAAEKSSVLTEACTVEFKDGSHFAATLRYCETFEQCEGAGGKFKDILIRILRMKKKGAVEAKK